MSGRAPESTARKFQWRRLKIIPKAFGEKAVLKLMFGVLKSASDSQLQNPRLIRFNVSFDRLVRGNG
jgi:hypothetical protein